MIQNSLLSRLSAGYESRSFSREVVSSTDFLRMAGIVALVKILSDTRVALISRTDGFDP